MNWADISRTERLLVAIDDALVSRKQIEAIKAKYAAHGGDLETLGEKSLESALIEPRRSYLAKLETLRATLTQLGVQA